MIRRPPKSTRPDTRVPYPTLVRSRRQAECAQLLRDPAAFVDVAREIFDADVGIERIDGSDAGPVDGKRNDFEIRPAERCLQAIEGRHLLPAGPAPGDRKSTRLNSSH